MALRVIEIVADAGHTDTLTAIAEQCGAVDCIEGAVAENGRQTIRILVTSGGEQAVLDSIQSVLSGSDGWRVIILPVAAALPLPSGKDREAALLPAGRTASREELYQDVKQGTRFDCSFVILTVLSSVVAAIGLIDGNIAVIIGAMVIAPLLGPNLAFAFGSALSDLALMRQAAITNLSGILITLFIGVILGVFWPEPFTNGEVVGRTQVGFGDIVLALASGAAAVLSLMTGLSSALVGVMVAVALMPPAVTLGMMLGGQAYDHAYGTALLLATNIVCVNLAAQLVFAAKQLGPRTSRQKNGVASNRNREYRRLGGFVSRAGRAYGLADGSLA